MWQRLVHWSFAFLLLLTATASSQDDRETCLSCHEDPDLTGLNASGQEISVFVSEDDLANSVHSDFECVDCHQDLAGVEDYPHDEEPSPVDCGMCHDDVVEVHKESIHQKVAKCADCHGNHRIVPPADSDVGEGGVDCGKCHQRIAREYDQSLHGKVVHAGAPLAPRCWDCHGAHDIRDVSSPESRVAKFNIPFLCGSCHKEGSPVTQRYDIPEDSVFFHYSQSIHGVGLYKQGLIVTAVCVDCHTAHNVRDHTDPKSSIHRNNVVATCLQCHGQIEKVHRKVIRGELWQKEPHKVPVCVDCHSPHRIRRVLYEEGISDQECLACHSRQDLTMERDGEVISLYIDTLEVYRSVHRGVTCARCHTGASPRLKRPCATVANKVDCSICHSEVVATYETSIHGQLADRGDPEAPTCIDCHGKHNVAARRDSQSPTYPRNVPRLCAMCHRHGAKAAKRIKDKHERIKEYVMSIHGKGLLESGLVVTAMCTDCHTAHHILPHTDPTSSVYRENIPHTCAKCHNGIYEQFTNSIHSPTVSKTDKPLPTCNDCHSSHTISRTDDVGFRLKIINQCGRCHEDVTESYFETFHGKVSKLGYVAAAKCYDCHGAHDILPPSEPASRLSRQNIVKTCGQCHPGSHRQFAGYLTHATHHDRTKYPILFYTFWFMTILLVGTLVVAGTHTLLWLPRSFQAMKEHKRLRQAARSRMQYRRFKPLHSWLHVTVVISFLGLALTGMTLKFSYLGWAQWLSGVLGGFESAGYIHRICAIITFLYFTIHLVDLFLEKRRQRKTWKQFFFNHASMIPNKQDWQDLKATVKWFVGLGPRPAYGRWTYWEKFDYFAVFWGVTVIGTTGLMLWFPELFTRILPGWIINVATIVHSDEALLAVAFIFTVHFFNTHFRPDKFPMDTVIFTGRVPLEELRKDRPREFEELMRTRQIKKYLVEPLPPVIVRAIRIMAAIALVIGLSLILLIIYAEVFGYR
jgi:cytochrome b subunit of formate dehydrogenase